MAATNFTPISLYYTTTASATPSAANLVAGELALNTLDEKLYFKNSAGTVKLLASNAGSAGSVTSVGWTGGIVSVATATTTPAFTIGGTSGGIPYFNSGTSWATSGVLTASALVIGGGAGASPSTTTTGTGVVAALGINTGSSGAFVVNGGALGTPASGTVTNLTGTASININGTVGATTAAAGSFTTVSATGNLSTTGSSSILQVLTGASVQIQNTAASANWNITTSGSGLSIESPQAGTLSLLNNTAVTGTLSATTTGQVGTTLGVGAATPSASGAGITFPATQSASSNANTLDDYEEGTWTPVPAPAASGTITSYTSAGRYTKIGRQVLLEMNINITDAGTALGGMDFSGIPFTPSSSVSNNNYGFGVNTTTGAEVAIRIYNPGPNPSVAINIVTGLNFSGSISYTV